MLQNKKLVQLMLSAVMALIFVKFYISQKEQAIEDAYGMVEVLTAARDIPPHTQLRNEYLTSIKVPLKFVSPGAFMIKIPAETLARVQGKVSIAAIPEGTQITQSNLTDPSIKDTGIAPLIPPGKRGYLLRLGNLDVAKLILPGDHIDILATFTVKRGDVNSKATMTILQNILVISVGKELKKSNQDVTGKRADAEEGLVLTLALEPMEAERMASAQAESQGEISVIVRPHGETDVKPLNGVTPNQFMGSPQFLAQINAVLTPA